MVRLLCNWLWLVILVLYVILSVLWWCVWRYCRLFLVLILMWLCGWLFSWFCRVRCLIFWIVVIMGVVWLWVWVNSGWVLVCCFVYCLIRCGKLLCSWLYWVWMKFGGWWFWLIGISCLVVDICFWMLIMMYCCLRWCVLCGLIMVWLCSLL